MDEQENKDVEMTDRKRADEAALRWYLAGLVVTGVAIGFFAGLSESPVAATLLPLLFTLIAGASGFHFFRADTATRVGARRLRLAGIALIYFMAACMLSSAYTAMVRTGARWADWVPLQSSATASPLVRNGPSETGMRLTLLAAKLERIGVAPEDRAVILEKARREALGDFGSDVSADMAKLQHAVAILLPQLEPLVEPLRKPYEKESEDEERSEESEILHPAVYSLYEDIRSTAIVLKQWTNYDAPPSGKAFSGLIRSLSRTIRAMPGYAVVRRPRPLSSYSIYQWLALKWPDFDVRPVLEYQEVILELEARYAASTEETVDETTTLEAIDAYIGTLDKSYTPKPVRRPHIKP